MRTKTTLFALSAAALVAASPAAASASSAYPPSIKSDLSLTYDLQCTLCHVGAPGTGTANTAFATAMKAAGLTGGANTSALSTALKKLETDKTDSDGNGTPDIEQLKAGCDPSTDAVLEAGATCGGAGTGGAADTAPTTAYGCGAQLAAGPANDGAWPFVAGLLAVLGLTVSRRRRG
jgi:hypothetical protein